MDARAQQAGAQIDEDAFVFSLEADCSKPMRPDYMTRRAGQLRKQLGLENGPSTPSSSLSGSSPAPS